PAARRHGPSLADRASPPQGAEIPDPAELVALTNWAGERLATVMQQDELPPILFFGNDWSAENRTSSHHITRWLARGHRLYYIECPGLRAPNGSSRDLKKIAAKVGRFLRGPRLVREGLQVWTLLQLPLHRFRLVQRLNRLLLQGALR